MALNLSGGQSYSQQDVYQSFLRAGLSPQQAANFTGVTQVESAGTFYTGSYGYQSTENGGALNSQGAYGIAQWNGSRQGDLRSFADANGLDPNALDTQTQFAVSEAQARGTNLDSTSSIVNTFEIPKNPAPEIASAQTNSQDIMQNQGYTQDPYGSGYSNTPGALAYDAQGNGAGYTPDTINQSSNGNSLPSFAQNPDATSSQGLSTGIGSDSGFSDNNFAQSNGAGATPYDNGGFTHGLGGDNPSDQNLPDNIQLQEIDIAKTPDTSSAAQDAAQDQDYYSQIGSGDVGTGGSQDAAATYTDPGNTMPTADADSSTGTDAGMDIPSAIDGLAAVEAQNTNAANKTATSVAKSSAEASANASKVLQSVAQQLTSQLSKSTTQSTATAQDIAATTKSYDTNLFVRGALIFLGLIFVAVALSFFKPVQTTIIQPAKRLAKGAAELAA